MAISSARFTPDGLSFVYSASWEGQPYAAFLGRPGNPDARDMQLQDARIMSISRAGDMAVLFGPQNITDTWGVRMLARIPLGRFPTMDEIAAAVCYLASDAAASITGQILVLDGGLTAA